MENLKDFDKTEKIDIELIADKDLSNKNNIHDEMLMLETFDLNSENEKNNEQFENHSIDNSEKNSSLDKYFKNKDITIWKLFEENEENTTEYIIKKIIFK